MSRIRIVLVTPYFPAHRGGIELFAGALAGRLAASGNFDLTWFASETDPSPPPSPGIRCISARAGNFAERRLGFPYPIWSLSSLCKLFKAVRSADLVHVHDCLYLPSLAAFAAARVAGRPVVVTQHIGMIPYRNRVLRLLLAGANKVLGTLILGSATQSVFVSTTPLRYFSRFVRFRTPPMHIENGVDTALFKPADSAERADLRQGLDAQDDRPLILFVGRFVEKKGVGIVRALAERFAQLRWVLVGWGPLEPRSWGLKNVSVHAGLSGKQLVRFYQAADLLVLPSVGEGFPLVVQEAMACGTPALVGEDTAAGCPAAGPLLLFENVDRSDTAQRWAARIDALINSPGTLSELRRPVAEFASSHWSWAHCARRYTELFSSLCAAQKNRS